MRLSILKYKIYKLSMGPQNFPLWVFVEAGRSGKEGEERREIFGKHMGAGFLQFPGSGIAIADGDAVQAGLAGADHILAAVAMTHSPRRSCRPQVSKTYSITSFLWERVLSILLPPIRAK